MGLTKQNELIISGERVARKGMLIILGLALVNSIAGYATGVVILYATAAANITDVLTLFASYLGLRLSRKRASKDFQYGFYKAETFAALVVSFLTVLLAANIFWQSYKRFISLPEVKNASFAYVSVIITILTSLYLYTILDKAAKKTNSISLKNNSVDKRNDIVNAFVVFLGIFASSYHFRYIEGGIGMLISLFILKNSLNHAKDSLFFLLDYWNDPKLIEKIRVTIKNYASIVRQIKQIRLRRAGMFTFGEIYIVINPFVDINDLRAELNQLHMKIMELDPYFKDIIIYTLVPKPGIIRVAVAIKKNRGLKSPIARNFSETNAYLIAVIKDKRIKKWEVFDFPYKANDFQNIAQFFQKHKINVIIDNDMHSLTYCQLLPKSYINIFPHFSNVEEADGMIKLLMIDN